MGTDLPPLRDIIKRHGLGAKKSLGQHFLLDPNLCDRIARAAGDLTNVTVIEIGPGPGCLTRSLLKSAAAKIIAVERDKRCIPALYELADAYPERLDIIEGDALETDIWRLGAAPRRIIANLPYNVATPLLIGWLRHLEAFSGLTLMFQKEVADRLAAKPGSKDYGRLSVITQWLAEVRLEFNVSKDAFTPPPKVTSSVVSIIPRAKPLVACQWVALETVTQAAFGQRRKMLRSSVKKLGLDLPSLGIEPTARAEELSVQQFCRMAQAYEALTR
ncbi:MAG: 16S rRNA (adenine(1518)-N(6)/adenine(1519)-N(6))-dimethyltransferase RsmA, partial [Proteobacteria bacterium]|nr:16S rRNA (adenine(1518)-N(6)/adenine(1519)-N(6))-dimethyltransferase RsmA [Pseudomonadota bacterium]MDA1024169.1 16S rRNA (adenine(1518)-N(6)/adenine(1519)-N(6))-dimethyltransferase RsmA [Pseudomonadota bacterium]